MMLRGLPAPGTGWRATAVLVLLWFVLTGVLGPTVGLAASLDAHVTESEREGKAESEPWSGKEAVAGISLLEARSPRSPGQLATRQRWTAPRRTCLAAAPATDARSHVPAGCPLPLRC